MNTKLWDTKDMCVTKRPLGVLREATSPGFPTNRRHTHCLLTATCRLFLNKCYCNVHVFCWRSMCVSLLCILTSNLPHTLSLSTYHVLTVATDTFSRLLIIKINLTLTLIQIQRFFSSIHIFNRKNIVWRKPDIIK